MVQSTVKQEFQPFRSNNGYAPDAQGPRGVRLPVTLAPGVLQEYDLTYFVEQDAISGVQTVRLNNMFGTSTLFYTDANYERVPVAPGKIVQLQCAFPADAIGARFSLQSVDGGAVSVEFFDVPMPSFEIGEQSADAAFLRINTAAAADANLVAGIAGQTVRVHRMRLSAAGAVNVSIKDGAGTILETFNFAAAGIGPVLDWSDRPYYKTSAGNALVINLSAAVQVNGAIEFVQR